MSDDNNKKSGLLSKVMRFVASPTTEWSDLDKPTAAAPAEDQFSRQALKEVMERKRRNDFVRKLEFDQLRKLRRDAGRTPAAGDALGSAAVSSAEHARQVTPEKTLAKINEIEQQMSRQWWASEQPQDNLPGVAPQAAAPTAPAPVPTPTPAMPAPLASQAPIEPATFDAYVQSGRFIHDAELEEAAVLFANGDAAGAEASLLALVQARSGDLTAQLTIWLTLFDLYRATGDQAKFDLHAIEFASKYGRSAPVWFSMPDELGSDISAAADEAPTRLLHWQAPPALSAAAINGLLANLKRYEPPWSFNWSRMNEVRDEAVAPLLALLRDWVDQPNAQIAFTGADNLLSVLEAGTPVGDKTVAQDRWALRLVALRLMGLEHDFDNVALDYCITYEVSPPSWQPPRLQFSGDSARGSVSTLPPDAFLATEIQKVSVNDDPSGGVLEGVIEGDASDRLAAFAPKIMPGKPFTVHCDRLMRIDFVAAGSVLNWVAECQQKQVLVRFSNLHRLNAVFFNLIGINEHSIVGQREN